MFTGFSNNNLDTCESRIKELEAKLIPDLVCMNVYTYIYLYLFVCYVCVYTLTSKCVLYNILSMCTRKFERIVSYNM